MPKSRRDLQKVAKPMVEKFFVELVQDIPEASIFELESIGHSNNFTTSLFNEKFAIIEGDWTPLKEAAFIRRVSRILSDSDSLQTIQAPKIPDGKFFVRFVDNNECHDATIEPEIGNMLNGKGRISFKDPNFIIRVYHWNNWFICVELYSGSAREFEKRRAPMRPFFSPISIDPRHARFMVNVSGTGPGLTIMDPFCGTGGILIEAGLTGRRVLGNDWSLQMSTGASLNLKYFGIRDYHITNSDFLELEINQLVDAVVTDLPYGRNSKLSQKNIRSLYTASYKKFKDILKKDGICVIVVSQEGALEEAEQFFSVLKVFPYKVHRSLTRYFAVMKRKS